MKKFFFSLLAAAALFSACEGSSISGDSPSPKPDPDGPTPSSYGIVLKTLEATDITFTGGRINGSVEIPDTLDSPVSVWFLWRVSPSTLEELKTLGGKLEATPDAEGKFSVARTDLLMGSEWDYVAVAEVEDEICYGGVKTLKVKEPSLTVTTGQATVITSSTATINGSFAVTGENPGSAPQCSFLYTTNDSGTPDTWMARIGDGATWVAPTQTYADGTFSAALSRLAEGTKYYYVAYSSYQNFPKIWYGSVQSFTTASAGLKLTTMTPDDVTPVSATLKAKLEGNAGSGTSNYIFYYAEGEKTAQEIRASGAVTIGTYSNGIMSVNVQGLKQNTTYSFTAAITVSGLGTLYADVTKFTTQAVSYTAEAVDLGLSVKWADRNVGADSASGTGDYFAWGEIVPKSNYSWDTYKWCNVENGSPLLHKYNIASAYGTVDNQRYLLSTDDPAQTLLTGGWRMPTKAEILALVQQCTWTSATKDGVKGWQVKGSNGNTIFIPNGGMKSGTQVYWNTSVACFWCNEIYYLPTRAFHFYADRDGVKLETSTGEPKAEDRYVGMPVRAVKQ